MAAIICHTLGQSPACEIYHNDSFYNHNDSTLKLSPKIHQRIGGLSLNSMNRYMMNKNPKKGVF